MSETQPTVLLTWDDHGDAGRVARVTFNNPAKRNALGLEGKTLFTEIMLELRHVDDLRAVVITGAGDQSFVGGTNLAEMATFDLAQAEASATKTHRACDAVRCCPVPGDRAYQRLLFRVGYGDRCVCGHACCRGPRALWYA